MLNPQATRPSAAILAVVALAVMLLAAAPDSAEGRKVLRCANSGVGFFAPSDVKVRGRLGCPTAKRAGRKFLRKVARDLFLSNPEIHNVKAGRWRFRCRGHHVRFELWKAKCKGDHVRFVFKYGT